MTTIGMTYADEDGVFDVRPFSSSGANRAYRMFAEAASSATYRAAEARAVPHVTGQARALAARVDRNIKGHTPRLYSVDMLFGGKKFWIAELNAHAGISLYYYYGIEGEKKRDERTADAVLRVLEKAI